MMLCDDAHVGRLDDAREGGAIGRDIVLDVRDFHRWMYVDAMNSCDAPEQRLDRGRRAGAGAEPFEQQCRTHACHGYPYSAGCLPHDARPR